jgi:hypothetical protein
VTARLIARPTKPAAITAALSMIKAAGCVSFDTMTTAVAPIMARSVKKCQA